MSDVTLDIDVDNVTLDTVDWFDATAENVTAYWQAIVRRCARDDDSDGRSFYSSQSVGTYRLRDARDRVIAALGRRAESHTFSGTWSGHTSNFDSNFGRDFGFSAVDLYRDGMSYGVLIFVSMGDYSDYGLDYVYRVESWDDANQVLSPRIGYYCSQCEEWGDTVDGGYSFDTNDGVTRRDVIADNSLACSQGHAVLLMAHDSF